MVHSPNGAPKRTLPHAAPHTHDEVRPERAVAARRAGRLGCGSCACVSARARSADEYEPSWAHWLPQQPTQSRLKGSRQARVEQGHARGRGTGFEAVEASSAPLEAVEDAEQLGDPRRKRTSDQPSKLGGLPPGKSQKYGQDHSQRLTYGKFNIMLRARG